MDFDADNCICKDKTPACGITTDECVQQGLSFDAAACTCIPITYSKTYTIDLPGNNQTGTNIFNTKVTNYVVEGTVNYSAVGNFSYKQGMVLTTNEKQNNYFEVTGFTGVGSLIISGTGWDNKGQYTLTVGDNVTDFSLGTITTDAAFSIPFKFNAANATTIRLNPRPELHPLAVVFIFPGLSFQQLNSPFTQKID